MKLRRSTRFLAALVALFGMLFMQLAVAGYMCKTTPAETMASAHQEMQSASSMSGMPDCGGVDLEQPGLCNAHAQTGNQSLDKPSSPGVAQFVPAALTAVSESAHDALAPTLPQHQPPALARNVAPPISISNCCFRN